ncbi:MAG: GTPase HflX [marine benthic group bacterium]|nr:GTPase HflX [Candidatus Carthagonibacter metallireducens]MCL7969965.1 GTPase HflX [Gemmatimonadota bacterium]
MDEHLEELARLADTAGAEVVGTLVQRLASPHPALYIGRGKAEQLKQLCTELSASLVVFDEDLTPAQGAALEKKLGLRVMDRTELILDIFALRARTAEARFQVELAQLEYMRPRLKRMWTHLSRTQGGIGTRGPGETQLETDRRMIDRRISRLRRELKHISRARGTRRKARSSEFRVALVGYTNAGKSSILKALSGSDLFVEDRLFATLDSATRAVDLDDGYRALLTDTVGFIRKLPHGLVASFQATLEEIAEADLLLHVIDASSPSWDHQVEAVEEVLHEIGAAGHPTLLAFNKVDQLTHGEEEALRLRAADLFGPHVLSSVREQGGLEALRSALRTRIKAEHPTVELEIPVTDGSTLAQAYREAEVLSRTDGDVRVRIRVRAPQALIGAWERQPAIAVRQLDSESPISPEG